jgi:hypothetical protein
MTQINLRIRVIRVICGQLDIVILDLGNRRKRNLHNLPARNLNLHAGSGEGLGSFHAANRASHSPAVSCNDLDVVLAVKRL